MSRLPEQRLHLSLNVAMFALDQFLVTIAAPRIASYFNALDRSKYRDFADKPLS